MSQTIQLPLASEQNPFASHLAADGQTLARDTLTTLQINVGKMCNLACHHCHVEAGPNRPEIMTWQTMAKILGWIDDHRAALPELSTIDLTGGAPEMNPHFRRLVAECRQRGLHVLDRCNLTILLDKGYEDLVDFFVEHEVEIVASLPCYLQDNVDKQRGKGVFDGSVVALQQLNAAGYGQPGTNLQLDLVFNPVDYGLPPEQGPLEAAYKKHLRKHYDIEFNSLYTITNMPIKRFEHALRRDGEFDGYMDKLFNAHNTDTVSKVMCRSLVSIGWEGAVYDCDFNQMLQMALDGPQLEDEHVVERESRKLWEYSPNELLGRAIATGAHCFGCTAGAGSSCTGALA